MQKSSLALIGPVLGRLHAFLEAEGIPCHMVGGFVRDQLLDRTPATLNIDLAVPKNALALSKELAVQLSAAFVPLDKEAGCARLVMIADGQRCEIDISDYRAPTLEADLALRDFTVNAIAIELGDWLRKPEQPGPLIDPLKGQAALKKRELSACFSGTFSDDPVRILRAFRFMVQLGFSVSAETQKLMPASAAGLSSVSGERIRDELLAIFETDQAHAALSQLDRVGALEVLIPELSPGRNLDQGTFHHLDVFGHQLEAVNQADRFLTSFDEFSQALRQALGDYCAEEKVDRRSRKALIKLAVLLHDVGKPHSRQVHPDGEIWFIGHEQAGLPLARAVAERLKLSNRESDMVCQLVLHHLRPGFLSREPQLTRRAVYRFFKDLGEDGPACLLEWWADRLATRGKKSRVDHIDQHRAFLEEMLSAYFFKAEEVVRPPRLVDGNELMKAFELKPGPLIGDLLDAIEEAQAEGRVSSTQEALDFARDRMKQSRQ